METWFKVERKNHRGRWNGGLVFRKKKGAQDYLAAMRAQARAAGVEVGSWRIKPFKVGASKGTLHTEVG